MAGYSPLYISKPETGLVRNRQNFILPNDAYPVLQNAYVWREQLKRKPGCQLLGRLQRSIPGLPLIGVTDGSGNFTGNLFTILIGLSLIKSTEKPTVVPGSVRIVVNGVQDYIESIPIDGTLSNGIGGTGTINYSTGAFTILGSGAPATNIHLYTFNYYPGLPVMGIRPRETTARNDQTIVFDQVYAYTFNAISNSFEEFATVPTTWNKQNEGTDGVSFFWTTNYWTSGTANSPFSSSNIKLFWETNNTGQFHQNQDPPRITDQAKWVDFYPSTFSQIDATNYLCNFLAMLPFRGRMVTFNTWEVASATDATGSLNYSNRIRWSTIGNPFIPYAAGPPATGSWRDDIRGQGGFLDIPTSEDIVSVGFVRDNLVIYCERSTWQLRYTGRSIAPFQVEKVNSELGAEGTFCTIQFDTSLVGIGDKGIVECDSYKSERIDIKIPDLVFQFSNVNNGPQRVQGVRDFEKRVAFWLIPLSGKYAPNVIQTFPNQRLVYNYENDSWALFDDSYTSLGTYFIQSSATWLNTPVAWIDYPFSWTYQPIGTISLIAGNQQGFVEKLNKSTINDISLYIKNIVAYGTTPTLITCPNHNLLFESIINISGILPNDPFVGLNNGVFQVNVIDSNTFSLSIYDPVDMEFSINQIDPITTSYLGVGYISVRDNFNIVSKKFNFLEEGQSIQMGYIDVLMEATGGTNPGAITLNVYLDYNDLESSNTLPQNRINNDISPSVPDTFFNSVIPTSPSNLNEKGGTKFWQRVYCATRANFLTLEYTFSDAQMVGIEQREVVQIDAQILWLRKSGRLSQI